MQLRKFFAAQSGPLRLTSAAICLTWVTREIVEHLHQWGDARGAGAALLVVLSAIAPLCDDTTSRAIEQVCKWRDTLAGWTIRTRRSIRERGKRAAVTIDDIVKELCHEAASHLWPGRYVTLADGGKAAELDGPQMQADVESEIEKLLRPARAALLRAIKGQCVLCGGVPRHCPRHAHETDEARTIARILNLPEDQGQ